MKCKREHEVRMTIIWFWIMEIIFSRWHGRCEVQNLSTIVLFCLPLVLGLCAFLGPLVGLKKLPLKPLSFFIQGKSFSIDGHVYLWGHHVEIPDTTLLFLGNNKFGTIFLHGATSCGEWSTCILILSSRHFAYIRGTVVSFEHTQKDINC